MQHNNQIGYAEKLKLNSELAYHILIKVDKVIYPYLKIFFTIMKLNRIQSDEQILNALRRLLISQLNIDNIMFLLDYHKESVTLFKEVTEHELDFILNIYPCTESDKIFFYILSDIKSHDVRDYVTRLKNDMPYQDSTITKNSILTLIFAATLKGDYEQYCTYYRIFQNVNNDIKDEIKLHFDTIRRAFLMKNYDFLNRVLNNDGNITYRYHFFATRRINLNDRAAMVLWFQTYHFLLLPHARYDLLEFFSKVDLAQESIRSIFKDENTRFNCIDYTKCDITIDWLEQTSKKISDLMKYDGLDFKTAYQAYHLDEKQKFWLSHYHKLMQLHPVCSTKNQDEIFLPRLPKVICQLINSYVFDQTMKQTKQIEEAVIKEDLMSQMKNYDVYQRIWQNAKDPLTATINLLENYVSSGSFSKIGHGLFERLTTGNWYHPHTKLIKNCLNHFKDIEKLSVPYILNYVATELKEKVAVNDINTKEDLMTRLIFIAKKTGTQFSLLQEIQEMTEQKNQIQLTATLKILR